MAIRRHFITIKPNRTFYTMDMYMHTLSFLNRKDYQMNDHSKYGSFIVNFNTRF